MSFLDLMKQRYSVRSYRTEPVSQEALAYILEAGRVAPTAVNKQPQRFLVIQQTDGLQKLSKTANIHGAPLAIVVCTDTELVWTRSYDEKNMVDIDATIATDHMMLAAQELGLGSCWITYFDPALLRELFNIPAQIEPVNILALGYAEGSGPGPDRHTTARNPLESFIQNESY